MEINQKKLFSVIVLYTVQREDAYREPQLEVKKRIGVKCPISLVDKKKILKYIWRIYDEV